MYTYIPKITALFLLLITIGYSQDGPAGVGSRDGATAIQTPELVTWLDAHDFDADGNPSNNPENETSIDPLNWQDKSGYDNYGLSNGQGPQFVTNSLSDKPAIGFWSNKKQSVSILRKIQDDFTIIVVFKTSDRSNYEGYDKTEYWWGHGLVDGEKSGDFADFGLSINGQGRVLAGTGTVMGEGSPAYIWSEETGYNDWEGHIAIFTRTMATNTITLWVDGFGGTGTMKSTGGYFGPLDDPEYLFFGSTQENDMFGGIFHYNGDIAEVILYADTLSTNDRQKVESYLSDKYEIPVKNKVDYDTGVFQEHSEKLASYYLGKNYPNPFNPSTTIHYSLATNESATMTIYNALGHPIRVMNNLPAGPGNHSVEWDGRTDAGHLAPSGVYFYKLQAGDNQAMRKMILMQ